MYIYGDKYVCILMYIMYINTYGHPFPARTNHVPLTTSAPDRLPVVLHRRFQATEPRIHLFG